MQHLTGLVVFTDLDGTLLDHDDYSWEAARPAISRLRENDIPLLAISSKTLAELQVFNTRHHLFAGLIGENGGVIEINGNLRLLGPQTATIDAARNEIAKAISVPVAGFRTSTAADIASATGLPRADAALAGQRNCSDPLIWSPSENDIALARNIASMLTHADIAVQIPVKHGPVPSLELGGHPARLAPKPGPDGWNTSIHAILNDLSQITPSKTKAR
jgi:mannosyl-3-phosphoglycerate phosphatase